MIKFLERVECTVTVRVTFKKKKEKRSDVLFFFSKFKLNKTETQHCFGLKKKIYNREFYQKYLSIGISGSEVFFVVLTFKIIWF